MANSPIAQNIAPGTPDTVARFIAESPDPQALDRVKSRSIAVSSGKGGVGKTITACNLAIFYARKGLRVGLVDLDPLSDVASLLDIHESEQALQKAGTAPDDDGRLDSHLLPVFRGLEILFPFQKLDADASAGMKEELYRRHLGEIDGRYDLLLFDMPAGMGFDDNLSYIPFVKRLILVTNPEPTAHASAGAYAKEVLRLYPGTPIRLWHNRYVDRLKEGFHPRDVAGNYNRFVDPSERLGADEQALIADLAFVPQDPALDLLQGEPDPVIHVLRCMRDCLDYAHGRLLSQATRRLGVSRRIQEVVAFYIHHHPRIDRADEYTSRMGEYLEGVVEGAADGGRLRFTDEEMRALEDFLRRVEKSALRREILRVQEMISQQLRTIEDSRGPFASRLTIVQDKAMDREIAQFLVTLNRCAAKSAVMRNQGVLLLFYFSLYKLFQSKTVVGIIRGLVPRKTDRRGRPARDRFRQIKSLVERDEEYRGRYLKTVRTLHGIVVRQIATVAGSFDLGRLVLRTKDSRIDASAYLRLLSAFLHETLYSGLSVIVGFDYRSAAAAFQRGAEKLLATLDLPSDALSRERN